MLPFSPFAVWIQLNVGAKRLVLLNKDGDWNVDTTEAIISLGCALTKAPVGSYKQF